VWHAFVHAPAWACSAPAPHVHERLGAQHRRGESVTLCQGPRQMKLASAVGFDDRLEHAPAYHVDSVERSHCKHEGCIGVLFPGRYKWAAYMRAGRCP
jgi:hypothetical protein